KTGSKCEASLPQADHSTPLDRPGHASVPETVAANARLSGDGPPSRAWRDSKRSQGRPRTPLAPYRAGGPAAGVRHKAEVTAWCAGEGARPRRPEDRETYAR